MKKKLIKNSLKSISKNKKRFLSLLFMALLGVGFFAGLTAASPDMEESLDNYLDNSEVYDINILATLGLTDEDITALEAVEGIEKAYGVQYKDYLIEIQEKEYVAQIIELNDNVNIPYLLEGRFPRTDTECLLDEKFAEYNNYKLGDKILIKTDDDTVLQKELKVVGICQSALYISSDRGNSTLGTGTINCYIYVKDILNFDYYTSIYAKVVGAKELSSESKKYDELIKSAKEKIEGIKQEREESRYNSLVEQAIEEITEQTGGQLPMEEMQEMVDIESNKWYIQTREDNSGYYNLLQAIESITNLAGVFPIVFYIIAVLISSTSMTRMVEEERNEIGVLKALGYSNSNILFKYILYSSIACIIGGLIGMSICFYLFPSIIWDTYGLLYKVPDVTTPFRIENGVVGLGIAYVCIVGATFLDCRRELKTMPATLMRPKAPKPGKRVFLERVKILWNHISFSRKVTIRNLFRYKKKACMTIIGIAGCTALTLAGFGLRDSITQIVDSQYGGIYKYDGIVNIKGNKESVIENLKNNEEITEIVSIAAETGELSKGDLRKTTNVIVPENLEEFKKVCTLYDENLQEVNIEENKIIITDKMAEELEIVEGDTVQLLLANGKEYEFVVQKIVENYINHYVYMSADTYRNTVEEPEINMLWINITELSEEEENSLMERILQDSNITSVSMINTLIETVNDLLGSLDYIVMILIMASAILALTVLYNLANVNISERKREIATLKVLGFYDKEVDAYISRESIIFTVVGIIIGLAAGYFLTNFIITTCETADFRFIKDIHPLSYLYAILITAVFSWIVDFIIHFTLKKIDMIESLKSVE